MPVLCSTHSILTYERYQQKKFCHLTLIGISAGTQSKVSQEQNMLFGENHCLLLLCITSSAALQPCDRWDNVMHEGNLSGVMW